MIVLGFVSEAEFCFAVSQYMTACDGRGIKADTRMLMMLPLYQILRSMVMVPRFPLYGRTTNCGMNMDLLEEILCGIQGRLVLYLLCDRTG